MSASEHNQAEASDPAPSAPPRSPVAAVGPALGAVVGSSDSSPAGRTKVVLHLKGGALKQPETAPPPPPALSVPIRARHEHERDSRRDDRREHKRARNEDYDSQPRRDRERDYGRDDRRSEHRSSRAHWDDQRDDRDYHRSSQHSYRHDDRRSNYSSLNNRDDHYSSRPRPRAYDDEIDLPRTDSSRLSARSGAHGDRRSAPSPNSRYANSKRQPSRSPRSPSPVPSPLPKDPSLPPSREPPVREPALQPRSSPGTPPRPPPRVRSPSPRRDDRRGGSNGNGYGGGYGGVSQSGYDDRRSAPRPPQTNGQRPDDRWGPPQPSNQRLPAPPIAQAAAQPSLAPVAQAYRPTYGAVAPTLHAPPAPLHPAIASLSREPSTGSASNGSALPGTPTAAQTAANSARPQRLSPADHPLTRRTKLGASHSLDPLIFPMDQDSDESQALAPLNRVFVGSSHISEYTLQEKLGEGTFGVVWKGMRGKVDNKGKSRSIGANEDELAAKGLKVFQGDVVALKQIILHNEMDGMPITSLREIRILKALDHPAVVPVVDIAYEDGDKSSYQLGKTFMVFPYMDHDLAGLLENQNVKLKEEHIKQYAKQLLEGTAYLHKNGILHRDMKAANLLINNKGQLMIADFGLARSIERAELRKRYTNCVVTRWYRPPELLLGDSCYHNPVDMWGVGCVIAEMFARSPIFPGSSDINQAERIFEICGSPSEETMPGWSKLPGCDGIVSWPYHTRMVVDQGLRWCSKLFADFLDKVLVLDPNKRLSAIDALDHDWFWTEPLPCEPENMPTYNASHEYDRRKREEAAVAAGQPIPARGGAHARPVVLPQPIPPPMGSLAPQGGAPFPPPNQGYGQPRPYGAMPPQAGAAYPVGGSAYPPPNGMRPGAPPYPPPNGGLSYGGGGGAGGGQWGAGGGGGRGPGGYGGGGGGRPGPPRGYDVPMNQGPAGKGRVDLSMMTSRPGGGARGGRPSGAYGNPPQGGGGQR